MRHVFIINPAAGKYDHTQEYTEKINSVCGARGLDYAIVRSQQPGDCTRLAREAAQAGGEVRLYACGGDGTLNEVVRGAVGFENAAVTHFPGGSGNDMIKIFDQTEPFSDLSRLLDCDETRFDLIRCNEAYSLNILSMGLDARIGTEVSRYKKLPLLSGHGAYVASTLVNLTKGISRHFTVALDDGAQLDDKFTMICVCNGRYYGGGFNPVPEAEPDDGLLDVLVVKKVSLLTAAGVIGKYKRGEYRDLPSLISYHRCRSLTIACEKPAVVNVDGEALFTTQAEIELLPQALRFFYPRGLRYTH